MFIRATPYFVSLIFIAFFLFFVFHNRLKLLLIVAFSKQTLEATNLVSYFTHMEVMFGTRYSQENGGNDQFFCGLNGYTAFERLSVKEC